MGEWSEYFEDFPDENPANYVQGKFDPHGANLQRQAQEKLRSDQSRLNAEIAAIVEQHKRKS
jgi:hypothetical protein